MAQYNRLTARDTELILNDSRIWANLPVDLSWLPTRQLPDAVTVKDYELTRIEQPAGSQFGEHAWGVSTARAETERLVMSLRYKFSWNKTDRAIAARNGYQLVADGLNVGAKTMNLKIAQLLFQGVTIAKDRVDISGMLDVGEDVNAALDTIKWNTALKPLDHFMAGTGDLLDNLYAPPYTMICSWNLWPGLAQQSAANGRSHRTIGTEDFQIERFVFAHNGTDAIGTGGPTIYPLPPATADEGVWLLCQVSEENFFMGQISQGIEISPPEFDRDTNTYVVFMEWRGTPVFRGATVATAGSAEYIVFEPDVDLV